MNFISKIRTNKLLSDSLWSLLGNVIGKGLALLAGIFIARFLGKDIFGEYGLIRNTILTIGVFSTFGLGYTATKFIADFRIRKPEKLKLFIKYANQITLVFSGLMAFLLFVFADKVAIEVLKIDDLGKALQILAVLIVFNAISTTQIGMLSGFGKFKELAKINSVIGILTFVLSVGLTYYYSFEGALLGLVLVQIINCLLNFFVVRKALPKEVIYEQIDNQLFKRILNFSFPIALQEFTYALTSWASSVLLIRLTTVGDLGMYTAVMQWNAIILFIPGILRNVVLSHLSTHANNKEQHNLILKRTIQINFIATLIPCIIVVLLSTFIASGYGTTFKGLAGLISIAVFSTIFTSISNVYAQAFTSLGKNWLMFYVRLFRDLLAIICFVVFVKYFSFNGVKILIYSNLIIYGLFLVFIMIIFKIKNND